MKSITSTSITLLLLLSVVACSDTTDGGNGSSTVETSLDQNSDNSDEADISDSTEIADDSNLVEADSANENRRSPQGLPNNASDRRDNVRRPRRDGRFPDRIRIADVEIRTYDGTSNNVNEIEWGSTFSQLQRLGTATYTDGISGMVYSDIADARTISNTIVNQEKGENLPNPFQTSDFLWQWGQFIDHDIDLTDGSADEPENIPVPVGDLYFDPAGTGTAVIPFNRALWDPTTGTDSFNPRQQENEITSWIDGSMIYGSNEARTTALRAGNDSPYLKTSSGNLLPFNTDNLTNANGPVRDPSTLFLAGDVRANEQVGLTVMHTLFVREHNRLARQLSRANPDASANDIFEATRRLVIAEIQIITYNEHLPALLGPNAIPPYQGYDATINPTVYNEFSAAAFRLGHSMVSEQILRLDEDGEAIDDGPLDLERAFFTAPQILQDEDDIDPIIRGLASQVHQSIDVKVIHPLRNLLFGQPGAGGLDLTALNIQRGRDHGLPFYNDMRISMGLNPISSFTELGDDATLQQSLQDAYGDVSKLDLWIGGLAERPLLEEGSQLGELFHAIISKQFTELRDGDRFWYQNDLNDDELALVGNVTLARIIRNNTDIGNELQDNIFFVSSQ